MTHCKKIQPLLVLYFEKELDREDMIAVESHLKSCATCRQQLAELTALTGLMKPVRHTLPSSYSSELIVQIHKKLEKNKKLKIGLVPAISFSSVLLVLALSFFLNTPAPAPDRFFSDEYLLFKQFSGISFYDNEVIYNETEEIAEDLMPGDYFSSSQEYLLENSEDYNEVITQLDDDAFEIILQNLKNMEI
ncbi:MAG: zf-HC2 domain-containing protein [Candidatus Marinimicrobia bacterium]|nr:zf-HC2 domain-containing protein [Candidatus Neomarinimicrobiota bacterium]